MRRFLGLVAGMLLVGLGGGLLWHTTAIIAPAVFITAGLLLIVESIDEGGGNANGSTADHTARP